MTDAVTVRIGDDRRAGRAVDCRDLPLTPRRVADAVRGDTADGAAGASSPDPNTAVSVTCPDPGPVHDHVGLVEPTTDVRARTALAAAARSRGATTPVSEDIADCRAALADLEIPDSPDLRAARERVAGTESAVAASRERVATLRGRLQACRDAGRDATALEAELAAATTELSERETERAAAREALSMARREARESREAREHRRTLEDRLANLERRARAHLVECARDSFAAAVAAAPGDPAEAVVGRAAADTPTDVDEPFATDDVTAALAVAWVATLRAPVVLACDRFADPAAAARWLDAPVVRVSSPQ